MAIKHPTVKAPGNTLAAVADWNASHVVDGNTGEILFLIAGGDVSADTNFFWDNVNKRLGVGTTNPQSKLHILQSGVAGTPAISADTALVVQNNGSTWTRLSIIGNAFSQIYLGDAANEDDGSIGYSHGLRQIDFFAGANPFTTLSIKATECIVNNDGQDKDFRVESDNDAHALFVEGSSDNVGIGTGTPATSAKLEIASTTGALLIPRMTTAQKNALTAINGMMVYDSTLNKFQGYENGAWVSLI